MLVDERIKTLAKNLVNFSCQLKAGENVLIEAIGVDYQIVSCIIDEVYNVGAFPFVTIKDNRVERAMQKGMTEEAARRLAEVDCFKMDKMQAYIGIRGGNNAYETSDLPAKNKNNYESLYSLPVHHERRVKNTKWVVLRYPTEGMSAMSGMSTEEFEDFYFNVCNLNYAKMDEAMTPLVSLLERTDKVRIVSPNTDLRFSIKDIHAIKCSGRRNIPDGEVYTAPVKDSVNGYITYNVPSSKSGKKFENIRLEFKDGKIVKAESGENTAAINEIFDIDDGARYVGEFALGVNPFINKAMGDILFDEKISGSIHFTPGSCYDEASNGNTSAIHWDLVLVQTAQKGGGEIYFDDVLIRKDGIFTLKKLDCLNPDKLSK